jgi:predicted metal-dependent HD superfamily phosphohydrolase
MISLSQRAHLVTLYNEPHRHYHNLEHIMHCLRELDSIPVNPWVKAEPDVAVGLTADQRAIIEAAIWFHDAVYDPKARTGRNEAASIDLMYRSNLTDVPLSTVEELIAATVSHQIPADEPPASEMLLGYFLDIDCAILGRPPAEYDEYARKIRLEYAWVPHPNYAEGRRRVLLNFLSRPRIYFTDHFAKQYEEQARLNLSKEIASLVPERTVKIHEGGPK